MVHGSWFIGFLLVYDKEPLIKAFVNETEREL